MGATTLDQVIETVAGVHLSTPDDIVNVLSFRGIPSRVLILVNNIPVPQGFVNAFAPRGNLLVNNVQRIEVIRGPGSAVYGADAMAGVVNIVTKTAKDINGNGIGGRAGSFDTSEGWFLHGGQWGEADVAVSLQGRTTNGFDKIVEADAQTRFDTLFGTRASRAPSAVNTERDVVDVHADISNGPWTWRAGYFGQFDVGTGVGFSSSLDPDGEIDVGLFNTDLAYQDRYSDHWDITAQLSYVYSDIDARLALFPPGAFGGAFPDGVRQELDVVENRVRAEFTTLYSGLNGHLVRVGLGGFYDSFDNTEDRRNYTVRRGLLTPTGRFGERGGMGDVPLFPDTDRGVFYTYLQDEWLFAPDWRLTSGLRVDHYSDFGPSVNPRIGLVWNTGYRVTTKLLYGRAFRPPSVTELHSNGILLGLGDPDLDPVTIDTTELSFSYRAAPFRSNLNFFWYRLDDIIELVSNRASNGLGFANNGAQEGYGLEWGFDWAITPTFNLRGNYGYQKPLDGGENVNLRFAPRHQVYDEADWRFAPEWALNASVKSIGCGSFKTTLTGGQAAFCRGRHS
ncbi:MAG: TonB-dependent receptor plug domain-containing protein [Gammaproteobacteria bacterium]